MKKIYHVIFSFLLFHWSFGQNYIYDSVRILNELNDTLNADAYPYISPDGLRIYFTRGNPNPPTRELLTASRANLNLAFSNISPIGISDHISCWLTNDELTIYYSDGQQNSTIYKATRPNIASPFGLGTAVNLTGNYTGFLSMPSLTPDRKQIYMYNSDNSITNILRFDSVATNTYALTDSINIPFGYIIRPGQLSKDGLRFYLGLEDINGNVSVFYYKRPSLAAVLDSATLVPGNINTNFNRNMQPSITSDLRIIAFVRNPQNTWTGNEMYIAEDTNSTAGIIPVPNEQLSVMVYPNPCSGLFQAAVRAGNGRTLHMEIYNVLGETVYQSKIISLAPLTEFQVDITVQPGGVYFLKLTENGKNPVVKKMIKW